MPETTSERQQNFYPLSHIPMFSNMVDEQLEHDHGQLALLQQAEGQPYILDDATVDRVIQVYSESTESYECFRKQIAQWRKEKPSKRQREEISRMEAQVLQLEQCHGRVLELAHKLKKGTIETVLGKSDIEAGMDFLSGLV